MTIKSIGVNDLRQMRGQEALILQGCGGDLTEWVDGINKLLTEDGILLEGSKFQEVSTFQNEGLTCLLFPMDDKVKLNVGSLAVWRLATHEDFGGTWLSDYVENCLGGFTVDQPTSAPAKPDCELIGQDGNMFSLLGLASRTLKENGMAAQAQQMMDRVTQCQSYDSALSIISEYVNITGPDNSSEDFEEGMVMQ